MESATDQRIEKGLFIQQGGGVGMIIIDPAAKSNGFQFVIQATLIGPQEAEELHAYMATER